MQKILGLLVFIVISEPSISQNSFSFNCRKDTTIECTTSCITLKTTIPDIHSITNSYTVNEITALSCFRPYVDPAAAGPSAKLTIDDRYSPAIDITFPFSFFGKTYNKLVASTNGFLSFDTSRALKFSHFGILRNGTALSSTTGLPEDLPSSLYDKALIMGPYHDLDPNNSTSTQQIKYDVIGTAPYRKWILSYYNVPLYTTACLNIYKNTHQIVLYETLGIVEVFIFDKEICLNWNSGRSIIGMQDFNKISAIMAPGRSASSAPWGTKSMNESWRFVPALGQSLFKKVELYTLSGNFVTTGIASAAGNNLLDVSFNVCPPSAGETYIVKSFYKNPDGSSGDILSTDTINILRGDPITTNILPPNCAVGNKGDITILSPIGSMYEYSIDGVNWQTSTLFKLTAGIYIIRARIIGSNCISSKNISVFADSFDASIKVIVTPCPGPLTASIQILPIHGTAPYLYSLNGGAFQASNTFTNLIAGTYKVLVTDIAGCSFSTNVTISPADLANASITNTICGKPGTGTITVTPGFGIGPYIYSINGGAFQSSNIFTGLVAGKYSIGIQDATSCNYTFDTTVDANVLVLANINFSLPICFGNTNGSLIIHPVLGTSPYMFSLDSNPFQQDSVYNNLAAGNYTLHIKDSAGCIKDTSVELLQPNAVNGTMIITPAATCLTYDGQITVKANGGVVPYTYSIDSGATYQVSNVFDVPAGIFKIVIKDSNNCTSQISDTVRAIDGKITVDLGNDKTICLGDSVKLTVTSNRPVNIFSWSPPGGLNDTTSATPFASPLDTTIYFVTARSAVCYGTDSIRVNILHKPIANAGADTIICNNTYAVLQGSASNVSGSVSYLWSPSRDMLTPNSSSTIVRPITTRSHTYRLQVSDNYGCNFKAYDDVKVFMNEPLQAFAGNDTIASMGVPHQLLGSGGIKYLWSPAYLLDDPTKQNPIAILQSDTRFNLIVKDTLGCVGTSSVFIKVYYGKTYYIPNAFTPNGDGLNDVFKAIAPGIQKTNYFRVYNRWGQLMFQTQDTRQGWDGTYSGVAQPSGVYVWIIKGLDVSGKIVELKGTVTLIR